MTNPHDLPFAVEFAGLATAGAGGCVASRHPAIMPLAVLLRPALRPSWSTTEWKTGGPWSRERQRHDANDTVWPYCRWLALVGACALSHALTAQPVTALLRPAFGPFRSGRFQPAYGVERSPSSTTLLRGERSRVNALTPSRSVGVQASMQRGTIPLMGDGFYTAITTGTPVADTNGGLEAVDGTGYDGRLRLAGDSRRGRA